MCRVGVGNILQIEAQAHEMRAQQDHVWKVHGELFGHQPLRAPRRGPGLARAQQSVPGGGGIARKQRIERVQETGGRRRDVQLLEQGGGGDQELDDGRVGFIRLGQQIVQQRQRAGPVGALEINPDGVQIGLDGDLPEQRLDFRVQLRHFRMARIGLACRLEPILQLG